MVKLLNMMQIITTISMLVLVSCNDYISHLDNDFHTSFYCATEEFKIPTKTTLIAFDDVVWQSGDQISIFKGRSAADKYQVDDNSIGKTEAIFNQVDNSNISTVNMFEANVAIYPYAENLQCNVSESSNQNKETDSQYVIGNFVLPSIQDYVPNSFGPKTFPMIAITKELSDNILVFKNICGVIQFQLKGTEEIKAITIYGQNQEVLSGSSQIIASNNGSEPNICMDKTAGKSITLDCGDGIQLLENEITNCFITLPPTVFKKGFTIEILSTKNTVKYLSTNKTNVIVRSSILTMPIIRVNETSIVIDENLDNTIPVLEITCDKKTLLLPPKGKYTLQAEVLPIEATNNNLTWYSSNPSVATVNQEGLITAISDGMSDIYAISGGKTCSCTVTVKSPATATIDYIDEYGINHGKGIVLGQHVWAPVNCGYHADEYPYGKLYQWGRQYGQGIGGKYDSHEPITIEGPKTLDVAQDLSMANYFIMGDENWLKGTSIYNLWNNEKYLPCPTGWRVPTRSELVSLAKIHSDFIEFDNGLAGRYFSGSDYDIPYANQEVFLPAADNRAYSTGKLGRWARNGSYWSSSIYSNDEAYLIYSATYTLDTSIHNSVAFGCFVRCIQK